MSKVQHMSVGRNPHLPSIHIDGPRLVDATGRQVMLRGVNLGGDCKVPWPDGGTQFPGDFADHRAVSFVGRPFAVAEADAHLGRLAHWGFNCLRLLTTWEAVEHAGPGLHDQEYLDYFAEICRRAAHHGLYLFVDFHQDVWSRMTGGDGAPGWTFEAAGLDFTKFHAAGAAHVMQHVYDYASTVKRQDDYPQMSWGTNYRLPANAIMWTLFWGGRLLTPAHRVGEENIQDYLQRHYLGSMDAVAARLRDMPHVLGFDTLNEPGTGWIGERLSYRHLAPSEDNTTRARPGKAMSALDGLAAARGLSVEVPLLRRNALTSIAEPAGTAIVNPHGIPIWRDGVACPFEAAGAYRIENGVAIAGDEEFFRTRDGRRITISEDGFGPLFHQVAHTVRAHNPDWLVFAELDAMGAAAGRPFPVDMPERTVNASHWYDASTLYLKSFDPENSFDFVTGARACGEEQVLARFIDQMAHKAAPAELFSSGGSPSLVGEFGIPFDLDEGAAYEAWANGVRDPAIWDKHVLLLGLMYDALDALLLHATQWNYTASNRNDLRIGDTWNQEDLSIFSLDQQEDPADPDSGGRAIAGFCRPFAHAVQGRIVRMHFDRASRRFTLQFDADPAIAAPTRIYVPRSRYAEGFSTRVAGDDSADIVASGQFVRIDAARPGRIEIVIEPRPAG
ncbi:cellulase family glycosylhydrolase [Sphingomonas colocasiae]|uniref:Cellulase family glycosylhydrolase n=2 Tax=Sphingomonas colocasiae TaxID=1848973 RepID=A0ABS7PME7_9SPHN|nr:cellulase family glycosylhydrolase [Sphingomonas colocasiae]